ncbi:MAG: ABC transporter substrate-binding protein [Christensenellales bacterium]
MNRLNLTRTLALILMAALLCAPAASLAAPANDKMFNIVLTAPFTGFDPLRTNDAASTYINAQIYETLYRIAPDGSYQPLLAEALPEFSADGKAATITLRQGVSFQDGTPFNAEAVKYTFSLIKDPAFGSSRASIVASIDTMDVLDDHTIRLNLKYEDGVLVAKLAHTNSAIVSPTAQANQDLMIQPVGTGPYAFVSMVSGANVVLKANEAYWGGAPALKNVTMTIISEESTAIARMETGEADFMPNVSVQQIPRLQGIPTVTFATSPAAQVFYVMLRPNSTVNPVMGNLEFRKALAMAFDTEGYTEFVMEGYASHSASIIGPNVFGYTPAAEAFGYTYDPEAAGAIIQKNGWADEPIKFLVPSTPAYTPMGEYFQSNLQDIGLNNVQIEAIDWSAWLTESKAENRFDISLAAWSNVTRDGTELLEPNWESKVSARSKVNSEVFDKLVFEGKTTSDKALRLEKLEAANKFLLDEALAVPVYNAENLFAYNSAYQGVTRGVDGTFYLKDITIK